MPPPTAASLVVHNIVGEMSEKKITVDHEIGGERDAILAVEFEFLNYT